MYIYIYIVIYYCSSYIKMLGSALWWLPSDISCLVEAVRESVDDMPSKVQRAAAATKKQNKRRDFTMAVNMSTSTSELRLIETQTSVGYFFETWQDRKVPFLCHPEPGTQIPPQWSGTLLQTSFLGTPCGKRCLLHVLWNLKCS